MNASTVAALNRINRKFYARYEESFSATRSRPWLGWKRATAPFLDHSRLDPGAPAPTILDVGCGNGRFALFLDSVSRGPYRYLGIDSSAEMIRRARRCVDGLETIDGSFRPLDLTDGEMDLDLGERPFDLIVLFGVLHHLPSFLGRRRLLEELTRYLAPAGSLILSFWQFGREPRFAQRTLGWSDHNQVSSERIDEGELERGDFLLAWGSGDEAHPHEEDSLGARRYCHFADPQEALALTTSLGPVIVDRFESDGRTGDLNLYHVLRGEG